MNLSIHENLFVKNWLSWLHQSYERVQNLPPEQKSASSREAISVRFTGFQRIEKLNSHCRRYLTQNFEILTNITA